MLAYARAAVAADRAQREPNWRHPKVQALIGSDARKCIQIDLMWQILEDPNQEFTASDMEYWDTIHDKLKEALSTKPAATQPAEPNAREIFNAGWCAAARFCDREDVVYDGLVGHSGCPAFEVAYRKTCTALSAAPAAPQPEVSTKHGPWVESTLHEGETYCKRCLTRSVFAGNRECDPHIVEAPVAQPAQGEPRESVWLFKNPDDGRWMHFVHEQHRLDTIADGRWEVARFELVERAAQQKGASK